MTHQVTVSAVGRSGDGVACIGDAVYHIPHAIPGDDITIVTDDDQNLLSFTYVSEARDAVTPPCALFSVCGGCATQRLSLANQLTWKTSRVAATLSRLGFEPGLPQSVSQALPYTRRRIDLAVEKTPEHIVLGLHRRKGAPVDMTECHLLDPKIFALLGPLRALVHRIGAIARNADIHINLFTSGIDLVIRADASPSTSDRSKLAGFAADHRIARISWIKGRSSTSAPEIVVQLRPVTQNQSGTEISPPPGVFMQATPEGERAIIDAVLRFLPHLNKRDVITELYCGTGALSLPMSARGRVDAYEGHSPALEALEGARAGKRLTCTLRDLTRQPLLDKDLAHTRVLVVDPPRSGATLQAERAAKARVKDVIYVSCSLTSLQNDLAHFARQGYALTGWSVIDQFLWSAEIECVIALSLDKKRVQRETSVRSAA